MEEKKVKKENFLKKAFREMRENAKRQKEVDKAKLNAVKAESKANFEENRGANTLKKAQEIGRKSIEDAKMTPEERAEKIREEQKKEIQEANKRIEEANKRYEAAKVNKK